MVSDRKRCRFSDTINNEKELYNSSKSNFNKEHDHERLFETVDSLRETKDLNILPTVILNLSLEEKKRCLALAEEKLKKLKELSSTNSIKQQDTPKFELKTTINNSALCDNSFVAMPIPVVFGRQPSSKYNIQDESKNKAINFKNLAIPKTNNENLNISTDTFLIPNSINDRNSLNNFNSSIASKSNLKDLDLTLNKKVSKNIYYPTNNNENAKSIKLTACHNLSNTIIVKPSLKNYNPDDDLSHSYINKFDQVNNFSFNHTVFLDKFDQTPTAIVELGKNSKLKSINNYINNDTNSKNHSSFKSLDFSKESTFDKDSGNNNNIAFTDKVDTPNKKIIDNNNCIIDMPISLNIDDKISKHKNIDNINDLDNISNIKILNDDKSYFKTAGILPDKEVIGFINSTLDISEQNKMYSQNSFSNATSVCTKELISLKEENDRLHSTKKSLCSKIDTVQHCNDFEQNQLSTNIIKNKLNPKIITLFSNKDIDTNVSIDNINPINIDSTNLNEMGAVSIITSFNNDCKDNSKTILSNESTMDTLSDNYKSANKTTLAISKTFINLKHKVFKKLIIANTDGNIMANTDGSANSVIDKDLKIKSSNNHYKNKFKHKPTSAKIKPLRIKNQMIGYISQKEKVLNEENNYSQTTTNETLINFDNTNANSKSVKSSYLKPLLPINNPLPNKALSIKQESNLNPSILPGKKKYNLTYNKNQNSNYIKQNQNKINLLQNSPNSNKKKLKIDTNNLNVNSNNVSNNHDSSFYTKDNYYQNELNESECLYNNKNTIDVMNNEVNTTKLWNTQFFEKNNTCIKTRYDKKNNIESFNENEYPLSEYKNANIETTKMISNFSTQLASKISEDFKKIPMGSFKFNLSLAQSLSEEEYHMVEKLHSLTNINSVNQLVSVIRNYRDTNPKLLDILNGISLDDLTYNL